WNQESNRGHLNLVQISPGRRHPDGVAQNSTHGLDRIPF
ncbi:unnamed protein product, partial [Gulo gulo]